MHHCSSETIPPTLDVIVPTGHPRTLTVAKRSLVAGRKDMVAFSQAVKGEGGVVVDFSNANRPNAGSGVQSKKGKF